MRRLLVSHHVEDIEPQIHLSKSRYLVQIKAKDVRRSYFHPYRSWAQFEGALQQKRYLIGGG